MNRKKKTLRAYLLKGPTNPTLLTSAMKKYHCQRLTRGSAVNVHSLIIRLKHIVLCLSWVLGSLLVSKFGILSQAVTYVWVRLPQVTKLRTRRNMTLAVDFHAFSCWIDLSLVRSIIFDVRALYLTQQPKSY